MAPCRPPVPGPASGPGRHRTDAARRDADGTVPIPVTELGARPTGGTGRHRQSDTRSRIASLDGLRGIAALVVVVYHVFLTQSALAAPYADPAAPVADAVWWATFSPLHLFWAGPEAVYVFFVLSGLVLALPAADTGRLNPWDYYPRRLVRLYLPVWAAVALAVGWASVVPRLWPAGSSWWIVAHAPQPTPSSVLQDLLLVWAPGQAVHVLWSLQWEVVYCLLLPFAIVAVRRVPRWWPAKLVLIAGALVAGAATANLALASLPLFLLGTLMAVEHRRLQRWAAAVDSARHALLWWALLLVACAASLLAYWLVHALPLPAGAVGPAETAARGMQGLGAGLAVAVAWLWRGAHGPLTTPVMQWLGSRSFSLYLVHLPVVATVTLLLGVQPPLVLVLSGTLLVTLPLTEAFYRLVERPSHRIARRAGRAVAAGVRSVPAAEVVPSAAETGPLRRIATGAVPARGGRSAAPAVVPQAPAPGSPAPVVAPQAPGRVVAPQAPGRVVAPQAPGRVVAPQEPGLVIAPQAPVRVVAPPVAVAASPRRPAAARPVAVHEPTTLVRGFPLVTALPQQPVSPGRATTVPGALFVPNVPVQAAPPSPPQGIAVSGPAPQPRRDRDGVPLGVGTGR
ncbi:acyltransferase family protein [Pseudonocardia sp.]|uniref:acyltransferase family protein n=1 Tax=Pseudonocardia sp. TaxID=60912 RepID=UPI003D12C44F